MGITLEQARALDALDREGTLAGAAEALHKAHTAVLYALRSMEEQLGVTVLDRSGYRLKFTPGGVRVLEHCRRLLAEERALEAVCAELRTGWEPSLRVVFDGIFPTKELLRTAAAIVRSGAPTRVEMVSAFLSGVETHFREQSAELMISILPVQDSSLKAIKLRSIRVLLVAHKEHPLAKETEELDNTKIASHVLLTVRGSDPRLQLPTAGLDQRSMVRLNDFSAKKLAIMEGLGFGWMPEYLVQKELEKGTLCRLRWHPGNEHVFVPRLYFREGPALGRAASMLVEALRSSRKESGNSSER